MKPFTKFAGLRQCIWRWGGKLQTRQASRVINWRIP